MKEKLNLKRSLPQKIRLKASTLVEMMIVMIVSGIIVGLIFEGIDIFRRYSHKITDEIVTSSDLLNLYLSLETIVGRSDSLTNDGDIVQLHRKGAIIGEIELVDSCLIIIFSKQIDILPQKVESVGINWGPQTDTLKVETGRLTLQFHTVEQVEITTTEIKYYED